MKPLLDTHVWLWLQVAPERLGTLSLSEPPSRYLASRMRASGVDALPDTHAHAAAVAELPDHHRDPFDRLLIAQAVAEDALLVTSDEVLDRYEVEVLHAG